jgi:hypothetical protein
MASPTQVTDQQIADWNQQLQNDPTYRQLVARFQQQIRVLGATGTPSQAEVEAVTAPLHSYLRARGIDPGQQGMLVESNTGTLKRDHTNRNSALIVGGLVGGAAGASMLPGVGAAAAGGAAPAAGTAPAITAAAGSGFGKYLPMIIGAGSSIAGTALAANAQNKATQAEKDAADKALALQKEQYDLYRSDTAPYRALGLGGVNNLAHLSGIEMPQQAPAASSAPFAAPGTMPGEAATAAANRATGIQSGLSTLGQSPPPAAPTQPIAMRTQDGRTFHIPPEKVAEAQARGAQRV